MFLFHILMTLPGKVARSTSEAFAAFYDEYLPKVLRYFSYKMTDIHQAEDLTATVFEKALTKFQSYTAEKAALSTWVFRIARNTLIDHYRVNQRRKTVSLEVAQTDPEDGHTPEQDAIENEESRLLRQCVSRLTPKEQEIISLKFAGDMTNRQIAGLLGLSDSNVGVILYRAIRKLRTDFQGVCDGQG